MQRHHFLLLAIAGLAPGLSGAVHAQDSYTPYGNGPVVIVAPGAPSLPHGNGAFVPGYGAPGYGASGYGAVQPYGNNSGLVLTPRGAVPYGRYNKDAARDAFRLNNALGGARAADEAAARAREPLTPLNPTPGNLR